LSAECEWLETSIQNLSGPPAMTDRSAPIDPRRAHHEMGGLPAGPVERNEHDYALWEKRVDAILMLLSQKGLMRVDELRRNIESLGPDAYDRMTYYERWIYAVGQTLIQRGVVTIDELGRKIAEVEGRADVSP
jgi:Nitrile hydratase beta subunit